MSKHLIRTTRLTVAPEGESIHSEMATHVEIDDEGAGEFVVLRQDRNAENPHSILIEPDEWPTISHAVGTILSVISCKEKGKA